MIIAPIQACSTCATQPSTVWLPIISLIIAALAVGVGPYITLRISRRQIELSRRIASKQIVAPMRQVWINELRNKVAELSSSALHCWNTGSGLDARTDAEVRRLGQLEQEIELMINPKRGRPQSSGARNSEVNSGD